VKFEKENGGSGLRYPFCIKLGNTAITRELGVDAMTGKLLEIAPEKKSGLTGNFT